MKKIALHPLADTTLVDTGATLLSGLLRRDLNVQMSCGGKGLCSTCHVWVRTGTENLSPVNARERMTLSLVADARPESRLACQCKVYGDGVEVEVPEGMYIESADDLVALLGTRASLNILHPVTGVVLIPKGKLITRTLLEQSRSVATDLRRAKSGGDPLTDSTTHRSFLASGSGAVPAATSRSSRMVPPPPVRAAAAPPPSPAPGDPAPPPRPPVAPGDSGLYLSRAANSSQFGPQASVSASVSATTAGPHDRPSGDTSSSGAGRSLPPVQAGTQIGKYLLIECIGKGGAGMVYRALHTKLKTPVAVKFLRPDVLAGDTDALASFTREAQLLAQLIHPNIVRVLDFEDDPARPFVVMEFVDGLSVADLIKQCGRVAPSRAIEIALQVIEGLDAARKIGVVHRDVKPGNILLTRDGTSKLVDLGLAVAARTAGGPAAPTGAAAEGTVGYMAPEQAVGGSVDHRADQYSLGCTLYQLVTGRLPFTGRSAQEVLLQHLRAAPVPPHEAAPSVPVELSRVVLGMMEKSPDDRYPDYGRLRADLLKLAQSLAAAGVA
ncbi:serine threonine protein kinase : Serine/threonine protein kinase OS=Isosphaera pallida (strain ATCC 43644 / DSM 9630 / IS1B) GN=Isop_3637 PE=3 SV=1: Fer2: Pkinase [Gemmataceae bacterium]|nr:serine threonine protein kinase : Serine/threonine protein kinase OS=Isosphaera pallida (strain ATCC 43644 / DSM 9630 / IS1B) GN=Isop_3637 PE=3 SV=1: Fer2: Pkinase [Gemmataceae bacterium]VTU01070.1 serine threonine protein kinase : Serine/threonine protein kinase OS=Isosphaera pallida (strain ATCC 43644 / DSM 9630 / IS1B) GN=Isop_3637 PE=3 SV=1: Fer2: Pkinase [Gemmataceae bacterium]